MQRIPWTIRFGRAVLRSRIVEKSCTPGYTQCSSTRIFMKQEERRWLEGGRRESSPWTEKGDFISIPKHIQTWRGLFGASHQGIVIRVLAMGTRTRTQDLLASGLDFGLDPGVRGSERPNVTPTKNVRRWGESKAKTRNGSNKILEGCKLLRDIPERMGFGVQQSHGRLQAPLCYPEPIGFLREKPIAS